MVLLLVDLHITLQHFKRVWDQILSEGSVVVKGKLVRGSFV